MYNVRTGGRAIVAMDRDTTRGDPDADLFGALDAPDLSDAAATGAYNGSGVEAIVSGNGSVGRLASAYDLDDLDSDGSLDEDGHRVTRLAYGRHIRVLLVESDAGRSTDFARAADESVLDVRVETVPSVEATLGRLERATGPLLRRPLPDVIVVALPSAESHRLLELLQLDSRFDDVPMIVLADTAAPSAERRSFALGATAHLVAPRQDYERVALIHALPDFIPRARAVHAHLESHRH
jgi:CheY-like chemotaxis protein